KLKEQRGYRDLSEDQAKADMVYRFVMENVKSDRPVWDVRAIEPTPISKYQRDPTKVMETAPAGKQ
ncbi:hypothetical protein HK097_003814, partial [Rhizophlyctis rosea]